MHSLLGECQRRCNLITEPQLVNTSFVGTACSVHREKAHCQSLKAFSSIRLHILFLWATESEICLTCDTDSIRACCNCWSVCLVSKLSNYSCVEIWWNSSFGKKCFDFCKFCLPCGHQWNIKIWCDIDRLLLLGNCLNTLGLVSVRQKCLCSVIWKQLWTCEWEWSTYLSRCTFEKLFQKLFCWHQIVLFFFSPCRKEHQGRKQALVSCGIVFSSLHHGSENCFVWHHFCQSQLLLLTQAFDRRSDEQGWETDPH